VVRRALGSLLEWGLLDVTQGHAARHLVDDKLFDRVQALLSERREDYSKRASATSLFLLAGLVVCGRCGKHFVGTSAVGNRYRYRSYTCFTRQRYGTRYCDAERLPAEELDAAVLDALLCTYERTDLFDKTVASSRRRARAERGNHAQELAVVDAGITKADTTSRRPSNGAVPARKALLQALVHEIRVEGRDHVVPWFRVPSGANPRLAPWRDRRPRQEPGQSSDGWYG
jgi:hypothetical protein